MSSKLSNNYTINGECSNCGECCTTFLPLASHEISRIKRYLKEHSEIKNQRHIEGNDMHILCAFRDRENKKCLIYEVRPDICRKYKCNQVEKVVELNKQKVIKKARINNNKNQTTSMQLLFFDDRDWEIKFFMNYCDDLDLAIKLAKDMNSPVYYDLKDLKK